MKYKLNQILTKYSEKNTNNYEPVAVGRYGIRKRSDIYKKELSNDYLKNKVIFQNVLIIGMGSVQIDVGVLKENLYYSVSPAYHTFKINTSIVLSEYLELLFLAKNSYYTKLYMIPSARQGKKVDVEGLLNEIVEIPNLIKQQEIIDKINKINKLTRNYENQLQLLDEIIKSRFVELFLNKNYEYKSLKDLLRSKAEYGAASASVPYKNGRPRYVRITDINDDGTLNNDTVCSINKQDDIDYKLEYGDFLFARMGATVGKTYAFIEGNEIFAGYLIRYKLDLNKINPRYLFAYTTTNEYNMWVKNNQSGAAQPGINAKKYDLLPVPVPPIEFQNEFASFVKQVDKLKFIVEEQLKLMNELLNKKMDEYFS